jgi:hypothetical protein
MQHHRHYTAGAELLHNTINTGQMNKNLVDHSNSSQTNYMHFLFKRSIDLAIKLDLDLTVENLGTRKRLPEGSNS